jgi:hypothetical protein
VPDGSAARTATIQLPASVSATPSTIHAPSEFCKATRFVGLLPGEGAVTVSVTSRALSGAKSSSQSRIVARAADAAGFNRDVGHAVFTVDVLERSIGRDSARMRMQNGVARRWRRAQNGDDDDNDSAERRLDRGIAAQAPPVELRGGHVGVLDEPRCQLRPVHDSDPDHNQEQEQLDEQKLAIIGRGQGWDAADQILGIDEATHEKSGDAGNAEV